MRHISLLCACCCALLFIDCAPTNRAARHQLLISLIKSWKFDYSSRVDPNLAPAYQSQRMKNTPQVRSELQFPELVFTHLKNRFKVPVTRDAESADGQLVVQAMAFASGGFKYVDVALFDSKGLKLAETRVWNADERNIFRYDDSFAEFAAERIADLIVAR